MGESFKNKTIVYCGRSPSQNKIVSNRIAHLWPVCAQASMPRRKTTNTVGWIYSVVKCIKVSTPVRAANNQSFKAWYKVSAFNFVVCACLPIYFVVRCACVLFIARLFAIRSAGAKCTRRTEDGLS